MPQKRTLFLLLFFCQVGFLAAQKSQIESRLSKNYYEGKAEAYNQILIIFDPLVRLMPKGQNKEFYADRANRWERAVLEVLDSVKNELSALRNKEQAWPKEKQRLEDRVESLKDQNNTLIEELQETNQKLLALERKQKEDQLKLEKYQAKSNINKSPSQRGRVKKQDPYYHDNPYYSRKVFPGDELVKTLVGYYYIIDLKDPVTQKYIHFDLEKYVIDPFEERYMNSITEFWQDFIDATKGDNIEYQLFIKGSADDDKEPYFFGKFHPEYIYPSIQVMRRVNDAQYEFNNVNFEVPNTIRNEHLPNLRAKFIYEKLIKRPFNLDPLNIQVLDGTPTLRIEPDDRNVLLLLYVSEIPSGWRS